MSRREAKEKTVKTWECDVCGTGVQGDQPPEKCLKCGSSAAHFRPVED